MDNQRYELSFMNNCLLKIALMSHQNLRGILFRCLSSRGTHPGINDKS